MASPDAVATALIALLALGMAGDGAKIPVTGGTIRGEARGDGAVFRGVPFAARPVGDRRWKPPGPVVPWGGVREAAVSGAPCLQRA